MHWTRYGLALALAGSSACATTTQITASWQRAGAQEYRYRKIAVVALTGSRDVRSMYEQQMLADLRELGIPGVAGSELFDPVPSAEQRDAVRQRLRELGVDGAISLKLVDRGVVEETVAPFSASDEYPGDFYSTFPVVIEPIYHHSRHEASSVSVLECLLYQLAQPGAAALRRISVEDASSLDQVHEATATLVRSLRGAGVLGHTK